MHKTHQSNRLAFISCFNSLKEVFENFFFGLANPLRGFAKISQCIWLQKKKSVVPSHYTAEKQVPGISLFG